jgi:hypothetical protein
MVHIVAPSAGQRESGEVAGDSLGAAKPPPDVKRPLAGNVSAAEAVASRWARQIGRAR